jgi:hypothetical protein
MKRSYLSFLTRSNACLAFFALRRAFSNSSDVSWNLSFTLSNLKKVTGPYTPSSFYETVIEVSQNEVAKKPVVEWMRGSTHFSMAFMFGAFIRLMVLLVSDICLFS